MSYSHVALFTYLLIYLPGVYASAHWCGPCRQFTPVLSQFYTRLKALGKSFEIVFASADNDEASMQSYLSEMPWLAIPYDADEREAFMANYQVRRLCVEMDALIRGRRIRR